MTPVPRRLRLRNRWRLTGWIVLVVTLIIVIAGFASVTLVEDSFTASVDDALRRDIDSTVAAIELFGTETIEDLFEQQPDRLMGAAHATLIVGPDGVVAAAPSGGASDIDPLPDLEGETSASLRADVGEIFEIGSVDGSLDYRAVAAQLPDGRLVVLASPLDERDEALRSLVGVLAVVAVVSAVVLVVVVALVAAYVTRPLDGMIAAAERIGSGSLDTRIRSDDSEDVDRLARALNAMLDRIETAFAERDQSEEALRRFVADASHELRTPLAAIIGYTELHLTGMADSPDQVERSFSRINAEAERMHHLVEDLLALARLDQQPLTDRAPVDFGDLVATAVADARTIDDTRTIILDSTPGAVVVGDAALLRQVADNLLSNVRTHTPPGTTATVTVTGTPETVRLVVADDGGGIEPDQLPRIFDRFHRVDAARTRSGGTGLGLAIVASAVDAHDGTIDATSTVGEGTTIEVTLPASRR